MTVDPFGPTPLNQSVWEASHAKEVRLLGAFWAEGLGDASRQPADGLKAK
ncbi:hypothetical protein [Paraburkholderia sp. UYCP14C]|nr:hypothetical protein [Paraburkholderia sp. UYCP14C]